MTKVHGLVGMCPRLDLSPIKGFMKSLKVFLTTSLKALFKQNMATQNLKAKHRFNHFFVKKKGAVARELNRPAKLL